MIWSKSHKLKVVALGAINGILFGTLVETVLRSLFLMRSIYEIKDRYHPTYISHIFLIPSVGGIFRFYHLFSLRLQLS